MEPLSLYLCLAGATAVSIGVSLAPALRVRLLRIATVLVSYGLLVALCLVDVWWRALAIWGVAGLATGLICLLFDWASIRRGRREQPGLAWQVSWRLITQGLVGWPDMLPQAIEFAMFDRRTFGRPTEEQ